MHAKGGKREEELMLSLCARIGMPWHWVSDDLW
jgi:hypothetical protein